MDKDSELEIRCSNSCTRSGMTALVLSVFAFMMLEPLAKTRQFDALVRYVTTRLVMKEELKELKVDGAWQLLRASDLGDKASNEWTLAQLLNHTIKVPVGLKLSESSVTKKTRISP